MEMNNKVMVYVPVGYLSKLTLNEINGNPPRPDEFWTSPPDGWDKHNLATLYITLETYNFWKSGKKLLKD